MEIQQSPLYTTYIRRLGWQVEQVDGSNLFIKRFPLFGGFAKLQRCTKLPKIDRLLPILSKHHVKRMVVEPDESVRQHIFDQWLHDASDTLRPILLMSSHYLPTKTIRIDLTASEDEIFTRFSEAKRRAVRRGQKNNLRIYESTNIAELIKIKNTSSGFLGFITTTGIDTLWPIVAPNHAAILLAYHDNVIARERERPKQSLEIASLIPFARNDNRMVGGILLLYWDNIAYYWIAGATREGKKLFAPTLLVWEALKLSKKRGAKRFDFVGVWDERIPKKNKEWLGFTKFKEGFGGREVYYPIFSKRLIPGSLSK